MEKPDMSSKQQLRSHFRQIRKLISIEDRQRWSLQISQRLQALPQVNAAKVLFTYLARGGEVDTSTTIQTLLTQDKLILTPQPDHKLLPQHGFHHATSATNGSLLTQPADTLTSISDIDVILVPGIVWDTHGHRVGFGGGYFDRLLAEKRPDAIAIGLSYDLQIIDNIPHEPWDQPVDILVTQSRIHGK